MSPATGYIIYRAAPSRDFTVIDTIDDTVYIDSVPDGERYRYKVSGYNEAGEGSATYVREGARTPPAAPQSVTASSSVYAGRIKITWESSALAERYYIYHAGASAGNYVKIADSETTEFWDTSASDYFNHYYRVSAVNEIGEGPLSRYDRGLTLAPPQEASAQGFTDHIAVQWSTTPGLYRIYRAMNDSLGEYTLIDSAEQNVYYDTVPTNNYYFYRIACASEIDESELSTASAGAKRVIPAAPMSLQASDGNFIDTIRVQWTASEGAEGYYLYRDVDSTFGNPQLRATLSGSETLYSDPAPNDSAYFYRIKAYNSAGESVLSTADPGFAKPANVPGSPRALIASNDNADYISLEWSAPESNPTVCYYYIYRADSEDGAYVKIHETKSRSHSDHVPGSYPTCYWYKVSASNQIGEGSLSAPAKGTRR